MTRPHNDIPNPMRIRDADLGEAVYRPNPNQNQVNSNGFRPPEQQTIVYTIIGQEDERIDALGNPDTNGFPILLDSQFSNGNVNQAEDKSEAYAKVEILDGVPYYYILMGPQGAMFNPLGLLNTNTKKRTHGLNTWEFQRVKPKAFQLYLNFLRTRNQAYLTQAQRELI